MPTALFVLLVFSFVPFVFCFRSRWAKPGGLRVGDGDRTHGHWSHNPALYQLSYAHQKTEPDRRQFPNLPHCKRFALTACYGFALSRPR